MTDIAKLRELAQGATPHFAACDPQTIAIVHPLGAGYGPTALDALRDLLAKAEKETAPK